MLRTISKSNKITPKTVFDINILREIIAMLRKWIHTVYDKSHDLIFTYQNL